MTAPWKKKTGVIAVALVPTLVYTAIVGLASSEPATGAGGILSEAPALQMAKSRFAEYLVAVRLDMGLGQVLFVFPTLFGALALYALSTDRQGTLLTRFSEYCAAALLVLYAATFFHPQYFSWFIPFLVVLRAQSERGDVLRNLHYLQIALFVPYTFFWGRSLFGYLFASLDPAFFISLNSLGIGSGRSAIPVSWSISCAAR